VAELAEDDYLWQVGHAGGSIPGVVTAAACNGGFRVAAGREIRTIGVVTGDDDRDGGGGGT